VSIWRRVLQSVSRAADCGPISTRCREIGAHVGESVSQGSGEFIPVAHLGDRAVSLKEIGSDQILSRFAGQDFAWVAGG
jgi:hypothetical protein